MCGRFTLAVDPADLQAAFPNFAFPSDLKPRFNIAPSQPVLVLPNDGKLRADYYSWGLIPVWTKDISIGAHMINARAETLAEKSAFRGAYKYKRCIIFADGFYEWKAQPGARSKIPYHIRLSSGQPFALAGLWDEWLSPDGSQIKSCSIITTEPNALMSGLHNRMPVILPSDAYAEWLNPEPQKPEVLQHLLTAYPASEMAAHPVSTLVNSPANDRPELVAPIPADKSSRDPKRDFS
ncbi:MAG: SOS response-associated peptidase [Chloroflexi bacterium]|nr:SOS response-associated peptidase [Chloroflexota bacterium]